MTAPTRAPRSAPPSRPGRPPGRRPAVTAASDTAAYGSPDVRPAESFADRWRRWWFEPESPLNLGVCRLLYFGLLFQHVTFQTRPVSHWATIPPGFIRPVWLFEKLHLPVAPPSVLLGLEIAWKASLLLS